MRKGRYYVLLAALLATGCAHFSQKDFLSLQEGTWRAALTRPDGVIVPFNFEVGDTAGKKVLWILNGADRMLVDSLRMRGDTVFIHMPFFNSDFIARFQNDGSLKGSWVKHYPDSDRLLSFRATPRTTYRIMSHPASPRRDVSGRWATEFREDGDTMQAVGEFRQQGTHVTGTFLTESGDFRYLDGVLDADTLVLSAFDGSHVFLFRALARKDGILSGGVFYSGFTDTATWSARRDTGAALPDAFSLTGHKPGEDRLNFRFPDLDGNPVSLEDPRFRNKVVIIQIMGSWCPNCMDETAFMSPWYRRHSGSAVEVVGLCYERSTVFAEAVAGVRTFQKRFHVTYPLLITGVTPGDPQLLAKTLPQLTHFVGFPTTIFLNKKGEIARIHAGFSGPGTGAHYTTFVREFNHLVDSLVAE